MVEDRLKKMVRDYEERRAAEVMAKVRESADDLAQQAIALLRKRLSELEEENRKLREENAQLRKRLDEK